MPGASAEETTPSRGGATAGRSLGPRPALGIQAARILWGQGQDSTSLKPLCRGLFVTAVEMSPYYTVVERHEHACPVCSVSVFK